MRTNVWDVSRLRRLLCWAKDEQRISEARISGEVAPWTRHDVRANDAEVKELEALWLMEDTR